MGFFGVLTRIKRYFHRPPPAQAKAQPAQAQAQAQLAPPPPDDHPPLEREGGGGGFVVFVTPLVKPTTLDTMLEAAFCTPLTMEAANSAPGNVGSETRGLGALGPAVGAVVVRATGADDGL